MARFEALITPVIDGNDLRETLDQIAQQWGGSLTWLDRRNASLDLVSAGLQLKFLLELRRGDDLLLLVTSREGMGAGAPRTQELLEKLLVWITGRMPRSQVTYRSDRDGPIRQTPQVPIR
jgi:hypothetical protein